MTKISYRCITYTEKEGIVTKTRNPNDSFLGVYLKERNKRPIVFKDPKEMKKSLLEESKNLVKQGKRVYIYGHDSQYDFSLLNEGNIIDTYEHIRENPVFSKYIDKNKFYNEKISFVDTKAIYNVDIKELRKILQIPEQPTLFPGNLNLKGLEEQLKKESALILLAIQDIKQTLKEVGININKIITAGQIAMSSFFSHLTKEDIKWSLMEADPEEGYTGRIWPCKWANTIRMANRGARCEAFQTGEYKETTLIDINSLYPFAMKEMNMADYEPHKQYLHKAPVPWTKLKECTGFIHCTIKTPLKGLPYLPVRIGKNTVHPKGVTITGIYTIEEIRYCETLGYELKEILWMITYPYARLNPFKHYVNSLYKLRKGLSKRKQKYIKLIMNNLPSKFAQETRMTTYKTIDMWNWYDYITEGWTIERQFGKQYIISLQKKLQHPRYYNPAITATIIANAKIYHHKQMSKIKESDLLYCDTDNILMKDPKGRNLEKFKISKEIGDFKLEEQGKAHILGKKQYQAGTKLKYSGIPKNEQHKINLKEPQEMKIKKNIGIGRALQLRSIKDIGTQEEYTMHFEPKNKDIIIPPKITETYDYQKPTHERYEPEIVQAEEHAHALIKKGKETII